MLTCTLILTSTVESSDSIQEAEPNHAFNRSETPFGSLNLSVHTMQHCNHVLQDFLGSLFFSH
jgi:hypothetical protein